MVNTISFGYCSRTFTEESEMIVHIQNYHQHCDGEQLKTEIDGNTMMTCSCTAAQKLQRSFELICNQDIIDKMAVYG